MTESIGPDVTITLPYDHALRLAYMARFPGTEADLDNHQGAIRDQEIADVVVDAIHKAEAHEEER